MNALRPTLALARRELRGAFSRWRLFVFLFLWIGAAVALNYIFLPEATRNLAEISAQARQLLAIESVALLLGLCVAVPSIAAVSVTAERDQETLDQLRLTLLTDRAILRGKAIASLAAAVAFIVAMMPVFAVAQFSVGLDNAQIIEMLAYILFLTWMIVQVGLASSAFFKHALSTLASTYLFLAIYGLTPLFYSWNRYSNWAAGGAVWISNSPYPLAGMPLEATILSRLAPHAVLGTIVKGSLPLWEFGLICLMPAIIGLGAIHVARWGLARTSEPKSVRQSKLIKDEQVLVARRTKFPYYLIDPLKPRPPIPDGRNAMFVREFRWGLFQRVTWMVRGTYLVLFFSILIFAVGVLNYTPFALVSAFAILIGMFALAIPATFGNTFTKEREQGNFDMLRMTLLNARDIIAGKTLGGLAVLAPALGAIVVAGALTNVFLPERYVLVVCGFVTMAVSMLEMVSLSVFASIVSRRTSSSVTLGAVLSLFVIFGAYPTVQIAWQLRELVESALGILIGGSNDAPAWWVSPAISPLSSFSDVFATKFISGPGLYQPPSDSGIWAVGQIVAAMLACAMFLLSGYILVRYRMRDR
jgi:hypothetical protein